MPKITFITYSSEREIIVTNLKNEHKTIAQYFKNPDDRDIEDYDRKEHFEEAVTIEPKIYVRWG